MAAGLRAQWWGRGAEWALGELVKAPPQPPPGPARRGLPPTGGGGGGPARESPAPAPAWAPTPLLGVSAETSGPTDQDGGECRPSLGRGSGQTPGPCPSLSPGPLARSPASRLAPRHGPRHLGTGPLQPSSFWPPKSQPQGKGQCSRACGGPSSSPQPLKARQGPSQGGGWGSQPGGGGRGATEQGPPGQACLAAGPQAPPAPRTRPWRRPSFQEAAASCGRLPRLSLARPESGCTAGVGSQQPQKPWEPADPWDREPGAFPAPPARLTWSRPPSQDLGAAASPALRPPPRMGVPQRRGKDPRPLCRTPRPLLVSAGPTGIPGQGLHGHREVSRLRRPLHRHLGWSALQGGGPSVVLASRGPCD